MHRLFFVFFVGLTLVASKVSANDSLYGFAFTQTYPQDSTKKDSVQKSVPKTYLLDKKTYKMTLPATWEIAPNCTEEYCNVFSPTDTLGFIDRFVENINITVQKLPTPTYTVDQYATFSVGYLPKVVKEFVVVERKKLKSNLVRLTYKGIKDNFQQTWRQYYYIKNQKVFIVTFACETSKYKYYQPFIESYLNSFTLK